MKKLLLITMTAGLALSPLARADEKQSPASPAPSPAPASTDSTKKDGAATDAAKADPKKAEPAKDGKQEPAAPRLEPGAVGDLASLQKQFPNLKVTAKPDGTLVVDERFAVQGKGTKDNPFVVTWDQLTSAADVYDPRKGQKEIPDRVQMLDGQFVTVTGYVAFPIYVKEPKEMLSMLNQWDGCCIGTPPTPYDAIEVHLKDVATKEQRMATYGTVTGRLGVKPYLVGDWLVGLYVMEEAFVSKPKQGGSGS